MLEKNIEKYLKDNIEKKLKGWCLKFLSTFVTGLPDRICLLPGGIILFVELKVPGKNPTSIQLIIHEKIRNLGFRVVVIDSKEKVDKLIKQYE